VCPVLRVLVEIFDVRSNDMSSQRPIDSGCSQI